jgi:hypothetical protein
MRAAWPTAWQLPANFAQMSSTRIANYVGTVSRNILKIKVANHGPKFAKLPLMLRILTFSRCFSLVLGTCLALSAASCGGEVDPSGQGSGAGSGSTAGPGSTAASGAGGSNSVVSDNGQYLLPDCVPGFPVEQASAAKPCKYFIGTTCYSKQKEACACACPHDIAKTTCIIDGNSFLPGTDAYGIYCIPG